MFLPRGQLLNAFHYNKGPGLWLTAGGAATLPEGEDEDKRKFVAAS